MGMWLPEFHCSLLFTVHQFTQSLPGAREPGSDGSDRHPKERGGFAVTQAFDAQKPDHLTLRFRQFCYRAVEVEEFEARHRVWLRGGGRGDRHSGATMLAQHPPDIPRAEVVHHCEKLDPEVRPFLPEMALCKRSQKAALHEILCLGSVSRQNPSVTPQRRNLGFERPREVADVVLRHIARPST